MEAKSDPAGPPAYDANQMIPGQPTPTWQQQQQQPVTAPPTTVSQPGQTTVVIQQQPPVQQLQTLFTVPMKLASFPAQVQCPSCHTHVTTFTHKENGGLVWLSAGVLLLFGLWLGCCLIPFCVPALKDTVHVCPVCKVTIGKHSQL